MIIIELRSNELRAIEVNKTRNGRSVELSLSRQIPASTIPELLNNDYMTLKEEILALVEELTSSYRSEQYSFVINIEEAMTQLVSIPKVKDKEISSAINSALISDRVIVSPDSVTAFAVLYEEDKKTYHTLSQVINKHIVDNIMNAFNEMGLKLRYIDISPNTIIKLFNESEYIDDEESPLDLIVDFSKFGVRYYQFIDKKFSATYIDNVSLESEEEYVEYFKFNVYQFLDEFTQYELSDMNIILMGEPEAIELIEKAYQDKVELTRFSENVTNLDNFTGAPLDTYLNSIGGSIRRDRLISLHAKYDINLLDKKKVTVKTERDNVKIAFVGLSILALVGAVYFGKLKYDSIKLDKKNDEISAFVNSPEVVEQTKYHDTLKANLDSTIYITESMKAAEDYFAITQRPLRSDYLDTLHHFTTVGGKILSVEFNDGIIMVEYETNDEASFMNYTKRLKSSKAFERVTYESYSDNSGAYTGFIEITLKGANPQ